VLFWLLLAAIPFVLPIASWVAARRTRARVEELSRTIRDQQAARSWRMQKTNTESGKVTIVLFIRSMISSDWL